MSPSPGNEQPQQDEVDSEGDSNDNQFISLDKASEQLDKIDDMPYALMTFGSLMFLAISLYLPQILKLKVGAIELEKNPIDQIKTVELTASMDSYSSRVKSTPEKF